MKGNKILEFICDTTLNLASGGVETDLEMFYKVPVELGVVSLGAMRRMQPDNIDNAASEDLVVFKFVNKF